LKTRRFGIKLSFTRDEKKVETVSPKHQWFETARWKVTSPSEIRAEICLETARTGWKNIRGRKNFYSVQQFRRSDFTQKKKKNNKQEAAQRCRKKKV